MAEFPEPACIAGAVLGPLVGAGHPSALGAVADTPGLKLTHMRADTPEGPVDRLEVHAPPADSADCPVVAGAALYAGPYLVHFGHLLAESIHRLWALTVFPQLQDARIVFQAHPASPPPPTWFREAVALCGADPDAVMIVDRPTRFEQLHVPAQGRALGGALLLPGYDDLFPLVPIEAAGNVGTLYVSRAAHAFSGSFLGESLVERVLADAGVTVVRPETMELRTLAGLLRGAERILFAEGSAIHALELCGRIDAPAMVIARRPGTKRRFGALLSDLTGGATFYTDVRPAVSLAWDERRDRPRMSDAAGFLDIVKLLRAVGRFAGVPLTSPAPDTIVRAIREDLLRLLLDPRSGINASDAQLGRALRLLRDDADVARLRDGLTVNPPGR